jgi:hypothetical protein
LLIIHFSQKQSIFFHFFFPTFTPPFLFTPLVPVNHRRLPARGTVLPSTLFVLLTHSFFLSSLSFLLLLVGCCLFLGSRPGVAPFLGGAPPWWCSSLVPFLVLGGAPWSRSLTLAVLLLGPFPRPRRRSCLVPSSSLVVLGSLASPLRRLLSLAPVVYNAPLRSHSSALVVVLLGPVPWPR